VRRRRSANLDALVNAVPGRPLLVSQQKVDGRSCRIRPRLTVVPASGWAARSSVVITAVASMPSIYLRPGRDGVTKRELVQTATTWDWVRCSRSATAAGCPCRPATSGESTRTLEGLTGGDAVSARQTSLRICRSIIEVPLLDRDSRSLRRHRWGRQPGRERGYRSRQRLSRWHHPIGQSDPLGLGPSIPRPVRMRSMARLWPMSRGSPHRSQVDQGNSQRRQ